MTRTLAPSHEIAEEALDRFWETVPPLWSRIRAHIREAATEEFRISIEQFQILRLVRSGKCSVSELAEAKRISRPAISQGVDTLVSRGLLTRTQDLQDRRHVQLALTQHGDELLDAIFRNTRAWMRTQLATFDQQELATVIRAMQSLKKMLD
jgi:DNA-binding MarR family transcriptional regulator